MGGGKSRDVSPGRGHSTDTGMEAGRILRPASTWVCLDLGVKKPPSRVSFSPGQNGPPAPGDTSHCLLQDPLLRKREPTGQRGALISDAC